MSDAQDLMELANRAIEHAQGQGADEVAVAVSRGTHVTISRRDREVEQATEATTQGLMLALTKGERYTSNSTNDLRPDALKAFIERCVALSDHVEPDPYRGQAAPELCGRGVSEASLDQDDPAWRARTDQDRSEQAIQVEEAILAAAHSSMVSSAAYVADGRSEVVQVQTNGFADHTAGAWFTVGGETTLAEGDRRPEAAAYFAARHLADLPNADTLASEVAERVNRRLGSKPTASGTYPMLLENAVAPRLLGVLSGPMSGGALHQGRSCLADRLDTKIASDVLSIDDDPTIPRGLGSRPWGGDCIVAKPRSVIENGVLRSYNIGVYYGRKLDLAPNGGRSNWVVHPGTRSFAEIAGDLDRAILVTGFLGGNSNPSTGDFSFGIRGLLLERGEVVQSLSEMNVSGNILQLLEQLVEVGSDVWTWSATRSPTLHFEGVQFSGT